MMILLTSVRNSSSQMPLANHGENSDDPSTAALLPVETDQPEHTRFNIVEHHLLPTHSVEFERPSQTIESCAYICVKHPNCTTFSYNGFTGICSGADICVSYQLVFGQKPRRNIPQFTPKVCTDILIVSILNLLQIGGC